MFYDFLYTIMGNKNSVYTTLWASNHSKHEREKMDFYATDPKAIDALLEVEDFSKLILEPACWMGHLSQRLVEKWHAVLSSDIVDRWYGLIADFFSRDEWEWDIITNPPYSLAQEFVEHALKITKPWAKVAMFLKIQFLEGKKRKKFFKKNPPKVVYVFSERIMCAKNWDFEWLKRSGGSAVAYAWYIWENGWQWEPVIRRI